ncbi:hypothetical protein [Hyphomonas sp.]|uniref:hypothetical protein n=1 Tax=Hyphomonas sp. TaxID=87 RepID=UPI0035636775
MPDKNRFQEIDDSNRADHYHLTPGDTCLYLFEYTSNRDYSFSKTNQLIANLKKRPSLRNTNQWPHKVNEMRRCSQYLAKALNPEWLKVATLVPVPPSKAKDHPEYDDRMLTVCRGIGGDVNVRELVMQNVSLRAAHETPNDRPSVEELIEAYAINEALADPAPQQIGIFDDVLTAGSHYRAMHSVLSARFPNVPIAGLFIARRVFPPEVQSPFAELEWET